MGGIDGIRLEMDYPCPWEYRVFGSDQAAIEAAINEILGDRSYRCDTGNTSEGGNWCTLIVTLEVADEAERVSLYEALRGRAAGKIVL